MVVKWFPHCSLHRAQEEGGGKRGHRSATAVGGQKTANHRENCVIERSCPMLFAVMTKACDKRLARLISYIHHTCEYRQYCHVGNTAQHCRLGSLQDSDFAGHLEDSKSTSGVILCTCGSHTFVPISWMCKKQTSISHSSTEAEVISLDAGLRMDGVPALDLWDLAIEALHSSPHQTNKAKDVTVPR